MKNVRWIKAAKKNSLSFPLTVQHEVAASLLIAAQGKKADNCKPLTGLGTGVFEVVIAHQSNAFRCVYAVQIGNDIWVIHAFQKKSKSGISTPKHEIDLVRQRIKLLKETLR
jgi:phage-related protein